MDTREVIIPRMLKTAGYTSGVYGKWDLGIHKRFLPTSRGFDDYYGFTNTGIDYYTHERYGVPSMYRNLEPTLEDKGVYCTYLFEREALRFLDEYAGDEPFFLYVPFNAPHGSSGLESEVRTLIQAPKKYTDMYPKVDKVYDVVDGWRYIEGPTKVGTRQARARNYRAAVTCMDDAIGKMLDKLEARGILDDTIVVFFSDNGGAGGADNTPLRGHKGDTWDGGIRVPCLVRWPNGGIPAGSVNSEFLTSLELFPSFASATGASLPEGVVLDGFDWWATLRGEKPSPRKEMFWQRKDTIGVRVGDWKWVVMGASGGLFNLKDDVGEKNDLSKKHPDVLKRLKARYKAWVAEMDAAEPRGPFRDF
ncbi:MAG: sulfatase-like hydrolase/transferase, partial [Planctomycetota bacterium]|jgi:arylsulfatase A-like enzyme